MRAAVGWRVVLIVALLLLVAIAGVVLVTFKAPLSLPKSPTAVPCPNIVRSSPQTLSTSPPVHIQSPCPGIVAGTFLGGSKADSASDVAVDSSGNIYVTGSTLSPDFPTRDAYDPIFNAAADELGDDDAFVAKFDATGALVFSTFLGGSGRDFGESIAVDSFGGIYVAGSTSSSDFPTTEGSYDAERSDTSLDNPAAFASKFESDGRLAYSTYLGELRGLGSLGRTGSIAVDPSGAVVFVGESMGDVLVGKLNPEGSEVIYSTLIGGQEADYPHAVALDALGNAFVTGITSSPDFPVTPGALDSTYNPPWPEEWNGCCPYDGFLFKLNPDGTALVYSTFLGGFDKEDPFAIAADPVGHVHVAGSTWSMDFPVTAGAYNTSLVCGNRDPTGPVYPACTEATFLVGFDPSGTLVYGTFLPTPNGGATGIDLDADNVYLSGVAWEGFPTTPGAFDRTLNGARDAFVAKFDDEGRTLLYSTLLGGGDEVMFEPPEPGYIAYSDDVAMSIAFDPSGNVTVVGTTGSLDFPVPVGAYDPTMNGRSDAFMLRMEPIPEPNRAPVAYAEVASRGESDPRVVVDASNSADAEDWDELLQVRWDWEGDGVWDTEWSTVKTASHEYAWSGTYAIRMEVRDSGGLVGSATREVVVSDLALAPPTQVPISLWVLYPAPTVVALVRGSILLLRWRSRKVPPTR